MRPVPASVALVVVGAVLSGCSVATMFRPERTTPSMPTPVSQMPSSRVFGTPFPLPVDGGDATITLDGLRIIASAVYEDSVVAVDMRAVQAGGRPAIDPGSVHAYDPGGRELSRIAYPKGTVPDPLVRTELTEPGQEVRGTIAWTMPVGGRIGRIDVVSEQSVNSLTVPLQPVDPEATAATVTTRSSG